MVYENRLSKLHQIFVPTKSNPGTLSYELISQFNYFKNTFNILKGDVLQNDFEGIKGKYIYDGENLTELDYSIDELGSGSDILLGIIDVPINFWNNTINHNLIIWCDLSQFELKNIINIKTYTSDIYSIDINGPINLDCYIATITYQNKNYAIIYNDLEYIKKKEIYEKFNDDIKKYNLNEYCDEYNIHEDNILIMFGIEY